MLKVDGLETQQKTIPEPPIKHQASTQPQKEGYKWEEVMAYFDQKLSLINQNQVALENKINGLQTDLISMTRDVMNVCKEISYLSRYNQTNKNRFGHIGGNRQVPGPDPGVTNE